MINLKGIIQNNKTASDFIRKQKKFNEVYKILSKKDERAMIEKYAKLKHDNGKLIYRTEPSNPGEKDDFECEFEWIGDEKEMRMNLIMHNLQAVTKISTKHCQDTRDYDDMYAKGLFGLTRAANRFHPFKLITKTVGYRVNENGKKIPIKEPKLDDNGNLDFIKFNTFAQFWILKYVVDEFYEKERIIENNSVSINDVIKIHGSEKGTVTLENFVNENLSPDIEKPKTVVDDVLSNEISDIYGSIYTYVENTNDLSSIEKSVLKESFYNGVSNVKKLSNILKIPQKTIVESRVSALTKLKDYIFEEFGIRNLADVL